MRMMGLDVGDRRIGVAICDPLEIIASTHGTIVRNTDRSEIQAILDLIREHSIEQLVVGLPRLPDGGIGTQAEKTGEFVDHLKQHIDIPIHMYDERFSTEMAQELLRQAGKRKEQIKEKKDAAAAALILQWYLDERASSGHKVPEASE